MYLEYYNALVKACDVLQEMRKMDIFKDVPAKNFDYALFFISNAGGAIMNLAANEAFPEQPDGACVFKDDDHEKAFYRFLHWDMSSGDEYHKTAAYLLALNADIRNHAAEVFDFDRDVIKPDALRAAWQTGESMKCTRLLFNLWNGLHDDDGDGSGAGLYAVDSIFCGADAVYYWEAVKIRFDIQGD